MLCTTASENSSAPISTHRVSIPLAGRETAPGLCARSARVAMSVRSACWSLSRSPSWAILTSLLPARCGERVREAEIDEVLGARALHARVAGRPLVHHALHRHEIGPQVRDHDRSLDLVRGLERRAVVHVAVSADDGQGALLVRLVQV